MSSSLAPGNVQYNYAQLEGIWMAAGGTQSAAPIAAAIAMAESGGNTTATDNDSNGSVDRGLWQINSVHGSQSTYDVMGNARAAVAISNNGSNWAPWTTYGSGAYRQFLQMNVPADTSAPINATNAAANQNTATLTGANTGPLPGGLKDPLNWFLNPLGSIFGGAEGAAGGIPGQVAGAVGGTLIKYLLQGLIITILNPMIQLAAGVAGIAAGGTMVLFGIIVVVRSTETGQAAEGAVGTGVQAGMTLAAPESRAATVYRGAPGPGGVRPTTTVTQTRRPPGRVRIGGRPIQYRQGQVTTNVQRDRESQQFTTGYGPQATPSTQQQLRNEAGEYVQNGSRNGKK